VQGLYADSGRRKRAAQSKGCFVNLELGLSRVWRKSGRTCEGIHVPWAVWKGLAIPVGERSHESKKVHGGKHPRNLNASAAFIECLWRHGAWPNPSTLTSSPFPMETRKRSRLHPATLSTAAAKLLIYRAFIEEETGFPKHLARRVHDLCFQPVHEEFQPRTM